MPCFWIADTFAATISSVSPNSSRRSLCPATTYFTSSLARNAGDTSPVNAPLSSQWQCCAPSANGRSSASMSVWMLRRSVNGGWMLRRPSRWSPSAPGTPASGPPGSPRSGCGASSSCPRSTGGARRPCHILDVGALSRNAASPGRSPSSNNSSDAPPPVDTWSTSSSSRNWASAAAESPPPTTVNALVGGDRLGHRAGAGREPLVLEHAHRAVPEHRARLGDDVGERSRRARADVEALGTVGQPGAPRRELPGRVRARRCRSAGGSASSPSRATPCTCRPDRARTASRRSADPWPRRT